MFGDNFSYGDFSYGYMTVKVLKKVWNSSSKKLEKLIRCCLLIIIKMFFFQSIIYVFNILLNLIEKYFMRFMQILLKLSGILIFKFRTVMNFSDCIHYFFVHFNSLI